MLLAEHKHCSNCAQSTMHHNGKCTHCEANRVRAEEAAWAAQSTDAKLLDLHRRIKKLEKDRI